jgi:hypothetical protein
MDPVTAILIPSIVGGLAIAWFIARFQARGSRTLTDGPMERSGASDVINISRIRAAGIGGLGLFAMALVVSWFVPRIGLTLGAGVLLGTLLGALMIFRRRRTGPLPSSGGSTGANVILSIDQPAASESEDVDNPPNRWRVAVARRAI